MSTLLVLAITLGVFGLLLVSATPKFKTYIPNGANIPNPCDRTRIWDAVGHQIPSGGVAINPFGKDFAVANHTFTKQLCMMDSDGDGRTNGAELGDPNCVWIVGTYAAVTDPTQLSHPGICEPINSPNCAGKNVFLNATCLSSSPAPPFNLNTDPSNAKTTTTTTTANINNSNNNNGNCKSAASAQLGGNFFVVLSAFFGMFVLSLL